MHAKGAFEELLKDQLRANCEGRMRFGDVLRHGDEVLVRDARGLAMRGDSEKLIIIIIYKHI